MALAAAEAERTAKVGVAQAMVPGVVARFVGMSDYRT